MPPETSGILFNNLITENDSINPFDMEFLYNGGGVAVGDFNNDQLPDLYFTASTTANHLYLNNGGLRFTDITVAAGVDGQGQWSNAASVVDINNDGLDDIYVCTTLRQPGARRQNLLYMNQGPGSDGVPRFKEMAGAYGLADTSYSVHAAFFDYDNDGDLDLYLVTTQPTRRDAARFTTITAPAGAGIDRDKLFRNTWNDSLGHPVFEDVSAAAGIVAPGFGLGVAIADLNSDGWKDIYVTNDFYSNDHLYINNRSGTFTDKMTSLLKHSSQNAMGVDIADINNDGLPDIFSLDMNPEDNFRKKKNMNGSNYSVYQSMINGLYALQYVRNTLQLNQGPVPGDSTGDPVFSDIGFLAGVAETDWSWTPSLADFDNDGYKDIIVTNGYPKDVTDHDFIVFRNNSRNIASKETLLAQLPRIKIANFAFRNRGNLSFEKCTDAWGLATPAFSNGAVYVDLDNDGDLDYVINNINDPAFVYENTLNTTDTPNRNYLAVRFHGGDRNRKGIGAIVTLRYQGRMQRYENAPYRGYLSTVDTKAFFGLDTVGIIDTVLVQWPGGLQQVITAVNVNQTLVVDMAAAYPPAAGEQVAGNRRLFTDITERLGVHYRHTEPDYIDFNDQRLLPHKLSDDGPPLASGDLNGDGLDDIVIGGSAGEQAHLLLQQRDGRFSDQPLPTTNIPAGLSAENLDILLFDADNDGDLDLYFANGSNEYPAGSKNYQDWLLINDGRAHFEYNATALPENLASKSCVKAADIDNDGDLDLFIGGRLVPGKYPLPASSFIYRNDSHNGKVQFTDVTAEWAPALHDIGLITDALWTDFDNDNRPDLVLAGEWMPLQFFKNTGGRLVNVSAGTGIAQQMGWWNSITAGDFDNDGDIDYIAGNLGSNSFYRGSHQYPLRIYAKDFDNNYSLDLITSLYLPDAGGQRHEYPAQTRDEYVNQVPALKKKFPTYEAFGKATVADLFPAADLQAAVTLKANYLQTALVENRGGGRFSIHALPVEAQVAPVHGVVVGDFNDDGLPDLALNGNDFGNEVTNGRYDALNGLLLLGNGRQGFTPMPMAESGLYIPGDGRALIKLQTAAGYTLAASQNNGPLLLFGKRQAIAPQRPTRQPGKK
ncbi:MAG: VCBS repeat-containing protein [Chitinophagaceae bacterium]|nr:VCBS repeat-containing protein [Chitinophagaceae bacterium]